jgi:hypothetical protein
MARAITDQQAASPSEPLQVDTATLDQVSLKIKEQLSKKMTVVLDPAESSIPMGAMVISGCITTSHLSARVIALRKTEAGFRSFDDFALEAGGSDLLPPTGPIGLAVHAARKRKENPSADAAKLADRIVKRIASDTKAGRTGISGN